MVKSVVLGLAVLVFPASRTMDIPVHCLLPTAVMAQEGNPGHQAPPPGWSCSQGKDTPADHACSCHRECKDSEELGEDGIPTGKKVTNVVEDTKCKVFCFAKSCQCPVHNCD